MNDTTDITTQTIRMLIFLVIAGIFYFILKKKKEK
ncbi:MAG: LPXTG-motif cell wall-anchored protein [Sulfurimonas sp.]|jgi:LPXTG-motif cell wall-anchored protein